MPAPELNVTVISPDKTLYDGPAMSVSSINEAGKFDILANHANFISLIQDQIVIRPMSGPTQKLSIQKAVIHVKDNRVRAFVGI